MVVLRIASALLAHAGPRGDEPVLAPFDVVVEDRTVVQTDVV